MYRHLHDIRRDTNHRQPDPEDGKPTAWCSDFLFHDGDSPVSILSSLSTDGNLLVIASIALPPANQGDITPETNPQRKRGKSSWLPRLRFGLVSSGPKCGLNEIGD